MALDQELNNVCEYIIKQYEESGDEYRYMNVPITELTDRQLLSCIIELKKYSLHQGLLFGLDLMGHHIKEDD